MDETRRQDRLYIDASGRGDSETAMTWRQAAAKTGAARRKRRIRGPRRGFVGALQAHVALRVVFSLLVAFLAWLALYASINPPGEKDVSVSLSVRNRSTLEDKGLILNTDSFPGIVTVTLKGRQEDLDKLTANSFEAVLDLSKIESVEDAQVKIDLASASADRVSVVRMSPTDVTVDLERYMSAELDIEVEFIGNDSLPDGYSLTGSNWTQRKLSISGRSSLVSRAARAVAVADLTGQSGNGSAHPEVRVLDADGQEIVEPEWRQAIDVTYEISKEIPVAYDVSGTPDSECYILDVEVQPETVMANGSSEALNATERLFTESVDVTGAENSMSARKYIIVPAGLRLSSHSPVQVVVDVSIDKYRYEQLSVSKANVGLLNASLDGDYRYEIAQNEIALIVRGKRDDMAEIDAASISALADVAGLRPGTSSVRVIVTLPAGITVAREAFVDIVVTEAGSGVSVGGSGAD